MSLNDCIRWSSKSYHNAPIGYRYKFMKFEEDQLIKNTNNLMLLKDNDIKDHAWPIIQKGTYKGYIGMAGYILCKIKI